MARELGPLTINVAKSRISFQARVRFAGVARVLRDGIACGFWLKRRIASPRLTKVEHLPPRDYVHQFKVTARWRPSGAAAAQGPFLANKPATSVNVSCCLGFWDARPCTRAPLPRGGRPRNLNA
jgi:hypothetical protein